MHEAVELERPRPVPSLDALILRSITDHAIVTLDRRGLITSWNAGAERIMGWREDEIVGRPAGTFFTSEDVARARPEAEMRTALLEGRAEDERWHVCKDGRRFWGSGMMMSLSRDRGVGGSPGRRSGDVDGFVKIFRDGTHDRRVGDRFIDLADWSNAPRLPSGGIGAYDYDMIGDHVMCDATTAVLHGLPPEAVAPGTPAEALLARIHPDDAGPVRAALARTVAEGVDFDHVYRIATGRPPHRWLQSQAMVRRDSDGRPARLSGIVIDVTEARRQAEMQEARLRFSDAVRDLRDPRRIAALAAEVIATALDATRAGHGYVEADGDTIDIGADWTAPGQASLVGRHKFSAFGEYVSVLRRGETYVMRDARTDPHVEDPAPFEDIGIRSLVNMPLMENGRLKAVLFVNDAVARDWTEAEIAFMAAIFDRTYAAIDRARSEAERDLMASELVHRMKNLLTIAQVIVAQSLREVEGTAPVRAAIASRLQALGEAQTVLAPGARSSADIADVVEAALRPYLASRDRFEVEGPAIELQADQVLGLSLALHELATNAAKHGALSNEAGRVAIRWTDEGGRFAFRWTESGGPPVAEPKRRGFGSTILERVVGGYFDGASRVDYDAGGLRFRIDPRDEAGR